MNVSPPSLRPRFRLIDPVVVVGVADGYKQKTTSQDIGRALEYCWGVLSRISWESFLVVLVVVLVVLVVVVVVLVVALMVVVVASHYCYRERHH